MSMTKKLTGEVVATGPVAYQGAQTGGVDACSLYDYIRLEGGDGQEGYLDQVFVPAYLDSFIGVGKDMTIHAAVVPVPTMFGSKQVHIVYAIEAGGKKRLAIDQAGGLLRSMKKAAVPLFGYGLILLPAWGAGLLFWIRAVRLLRLSLPIAEMSKA